MNLRILLMGYGNPARQDDGLGPAVIAEFERRGHPGLILDANYQPSVEDAWSLCEVDRAILVDAAVDGPEPFSFLPLHAPTKVGFSTHTLRPEAIPGLAASLFGRQVPTWLLAIRGYSFEPFQETPTDKAKDNLSQALLFLDKLLIDWQNDDQEGEMAPPTPAERP